MLKVLSLLLTLCLLQAVQAGVPCSTLAPNGLSVACPTQCTRPTVTVTDSVIETKSYTYPCQTYTTTVHLSTLYSTPTPVPVAKRQDGSAVGCTVTLPCKDCTNYPVTTTKYVTSTTTQTFYLPCAYFVTTVTVP